MAEYFLFPKIKSLEFSMAFLKCSAFCEDLNVTWWVSLYRTVYRVYFLLQQGLSIYLSIYLSIQSKRETMCPSGYYQSSNILMVTYAFGLMMYDCTLLVPVKEIVLNTSCKEHNKNCLTSWGFFCSLVAAKCNPCIICTIVWFTMKPLAIW